MLNEEMKELLMLAAGYEINDGTLIWDDELNFAILCNDLFYWATADCEPIKSQGDIDLLVSSMKDVGDDEINGPYLYCCRKRGMRPQTPFYRYIHQCNHELFNECGPSRDRRMK